MLKDLSLQKPWPSIFPGSVLNASRTALFQVSLMKILSMMQQTCRTMRGWYSLILCESSRLLCSRSCSRWTVSQKGSSTRWDINVQASPDTDSSALLQGASIFDGGSGMMNPFSSLFSGDTSVNQLRVHSSRRSRTVCSKRPVSKNHSMEISSFCPTMGRGDMGQIPSSFSMSLLVINAGAHIVVDVLSASKPMKECRGQFSSAYMHSAGMLPQFLRRRCLLSAFVLACG